MSATKDDRTTADIIDDCYRELLERKIHYLHVKAKELTTAKTFVTAPGITRVAYILDLVDAIHHYTYGGNSPDDVFANQAKQFLRGLCLRYALTKRIKAEPGDLVSIIRAFLSHRTRYDATILHWPLSELVRQIEWMFSEKKLSGDLRQALVDLRGSIEKLNSILSTASKLLDRINAVLGEVERIIVQKTFEETDHFGAFANKHIGQLAAKKQRGWEKLITLSAAATGSKPTKKFLKQSSVLVSEIGQQFLFKSLSILFNYLVRLNVKRQLQSPLEMPQILSRVNSRIVTSLVWVCALKEDPDLLSLLARVCLRGYKSLPSRGASFAAVANACLYVMSRSSSGQSLSLLVSLKYSLPFDSVRKRIERYLQVKAKALGITSMQLEEQYVETHGLTDGKRSIQVGRYVADIELSGHKVQLTWKHSSDVLEEIPAELNDNHDEVLEDLNRLLHDIRFTFQMQRQRIDLMFRAPRQFEWKYFEDHYLNHGLMGAITKSLLWVIDGKTYSFQMGEWQTLEGQPLSRSASTVVIWHSLLAPTTELLRWRERYLSTRRQECVKQVFREIYIITAAERSTRTYSNRMAGHIVKQHQFALLARTRHWHYRLQNNASDGQLGEIAIHHSLYHPGLRAEFFIRTLPDSTSNLTGTYTYVSSDTIKFFKDGTLMPLADVDKIYFSEIMRDCDLFVGVASVANDPSWYDSGGETTYRTYWERSVFGALDEFALMRRIVLQSLIGSPPFEGRCHLEERFLVVRGKLRTYRIHLGSTHIQVQPENQFLCIVSAGSSPSLFVPFDNDLALSVIISKAVMLLRDDEITDASILKQFKS